MATINATECFGLENKGAIAPGYKADFFLFDDMNKINIRTVFKDGRAVVDNGQLTMDLNNQTFVETERLRNSVRYHELTVEHFHIPLKTNKANIIEIIPNSLVTRHIIEKVEKNNAGFFQTSITNDQLKLAVIERHHLKIKLV